MKTFIIGSIIASVLGLMTPQTIRAQGTVYLSNLGQTSTGSYAVGIDSWLAAAFSTGGNTGGYVLNSVQLEMTDASGNPSGFSVMLYGTNGSPFGINPGGSLGTLNGSANPSIAGIFTYTPASSLMLSPNMDYFIVLTATTATANGAYNWSIEDTARPDSNGWLGYGVLQSSDGQSNWRFLDIGTYSEFAIMATAIPEPSVLGLLGLGGLFLIRYRRRF